MTMKSWVRIPVGDFSLCVSFSQRRVTGHTPFIPLSDRKLSRLWDPASAGLMDEAITLGGVKTECTEASNHRKNVEGRWRLNLT